jgi:energy-coupling factor transport system substrate-specific component
VTTAYLLTCAAIGVAGGAVLVFANWVSTALFAAVPFFAVAIAGLWLLPAVIALRLLERPLAGLLVGLISGLVIVPFSGYGFSSVATNLWWAFFAELPFLIVLYRFWKTWQHYAGALVVSVVYPVLAWASFDLGSMALVAQIGFFAVLLASTMVATALGIVVADRLRAAGVARLARRRPQTSTKPLPGTEPTPG